MVCADDDFVDHTQALKHCFFMLIRNRWSPLFVMPKHFLGSKTNREMVSKSTRLLEKLNMTSMNNIVTAGDKNSFHNK